MDAEMLMFIMGSTIQVFSLGVCMAFTLALCQKKKPVEDLMAKPKFTAPVTTVQKASQEARNTPKEAPKAPPTSQKPDIEHTISIKLDNNDEEEIQGPKESMSREPITDVKPPGGSGGTAQSSTNNEDPDKDCVTPTSHVDQKKGAGGGGPSPLVKDLSQSKKKKKTAELDATQEMKTKEESHRPLSLKSVKSLRGKRKGKGKAQTPGTKEGTAEAAAGGGNKSVMSTKQTQQTPTKQSPKPGEGRTQSPNCQKADGGPTKEVEPTQEEH